MTFSSTELWLLLSEGYSELFVYRVVDVCEVPHTNEGRVERDVKEKIEKQVMEKTVV